MASNNLFAPPSKEELDTVKNTVFAPPTKEEIEASEGMGTAEKWGRGLLKALPAAGALAGGVIGTGLGPAGTFGGGMLGAGAGRSLQNIGEGLLGDEKTRQEIYQGPVNEMALDAAGAGAGTLIEKGLRPVVGAVEDLGKNIYKSAFKKIDERLAETGAKPFSDVMLEHGVTGTTKNVQKEAERIKKGLLNERQGLYDEGQNAGASVNVENASQEALAEAQRLQGVRGAQDLGHDLERNVRSYYEPVEDVQNLGSYTVPKRVIEGETKTIVPQYGPHGEVLNTDELIKKEGSYVVPGQTLEGETRIINPERGPYGEVMNKEDLIRRTGEVPIESSSYDLVQELDPNTMKMVNKRVPKGESAGSYKTESYSPKEVKEPDINIPSTKVKSTTYQPKAVKEDDLVIPSTSIDIIKDPKKKFNWMTMKDEKVKLPDLSLAEASELKTRLRDRLPDSAFNKFGKVKGDAKKITKAQAAGLRKEIIDQANKVRPGLGDEIDKLNENLGSLIQAEKPVAMQVRRGETANIVTPVDAVLNTVNPTAGAAKKLADLSKLTYARTKAGKGLIDLSKTKLADKNMYRGLIHAPKDNEK